MLTGFDLAESIRRKAKADFEKEKRRMRIQLALVFSLGLISGALISTLIVFTYGKQ